MRKIFLLVACCVLMVSALFAQTKLGSEKGVSSIGFMAGYAIDNKSFAAGIDFRYNILAHVRLAPSVIYLFKNNNVSTWYANVDFHYLARITERVTIYPIMGVGLSAWQRDYLVPVTSEDDIEYRKETNSEARLGLNLGAGVERRMTRDIILGAEFKYNLTTDRAHDQAMILTRIAYYF